MEDISFLPTLYKMLTSQNLQIAEKKGKFTAHRTERTNISKSKLISSQERKTKKKRRKKAKKKTQRQLTMQVPAHSAVAELTRQITIEADIPDLHVCA